MCIIEIRGLKKQFNGIEAVSGLDLDVHKGEIYGFLGPNGAGKTTTIRMMIGLIKPTTGTVKIYGKNIDEHGHSIRKNIGYLPERVSFYSNLSMKENMQFLCEMKGCSKDVIGELLNEFELEKHRDKKCSHLSKGMTQRLGIAQTLIGDPDIMILDEPTAGLDPNIRRWVKEKIFSLKDRGKTIFLSSHVLSEVQELCQRVGILNDGVLLAQDHVDDLGDRLALKDRLELKVDQIGEALDRLKGLDYVERPSLFKGNIVLYVSSERKADVVKELIEDGFDIHDFHVKEPDLEEVFVRLTGGDGR